VGRVTVVLAGSRASKGRYQVGTGIPCNRSNQKKRGEEGVTLRQGGESRLELGRK